MILSLCMCYEKNGHFIRSGWVEDNAIKKWIYEYARTDKKIKIYETCTPVSRNPNGKGGIRAYTLNGYKNLQVD